MLIPPIGRRRADKLLNHQIAAQQPMDRCGLLTEIDMGIRLSSNKTT